MSFSSSTLKLLSIAVLFALLMGFFLAGNLDKENNTNVSGDISDKSQVEPLHSLELEPLKEDPLPIHYVTTIKPTPAPALTLTPEPAVGSDCGTRIKTVIMNFFLALSLFFLNGYIGRILYGYKSLFNYGKFSFKSNDSESFEGNFFLKIVNPAVFTALIASIFQYSRFDYLVSSLWQLVLFYWGIILVYYIIRNYFIFLFEVPAFIASVLISESVFFIIIKPLYTRQESIFMPITALRDGIWYAIIAYLLTAIWSIMKQYFNGYSLYPDKKRRELIQRRYMKYSKKYRLSIDNATRALSAPAFSEDNLSKFNALLYAIMIYEDYNRSYFIRKIENIMIQLKIKETMTLGIMQVTANHEITDDESIKIAANKLFPFFIVAGRFAITQNEIYEALQNYNLGRSYKDEVYSIYMELLEQVSYDECIKDYVII